MLNGPHAQRGHVPVEVVLPNRRERVVRLPGTVRRLVQHVIDVGNVPAYLGLHANEAQRPGQRIDLDERGRMPQVRDIVRRDPARIDPGAIEDRQPAATQDQAAHLGDRGVSPRLGHDPSVAASALPVNADRADGRETPASASSKRQDTVTLARSGPPARGLPPHHLPARPALSGQPATTACACS